MKVLVTGGTIFVSKFIATYFRDRENDVFVLNRGTREQIRGVYHIKADRNDLKGCLKDIHFDLVVDVCAYTKNDVENLLTGLGSYRHYVFISSSAVYPETLSQPFVETQRVGENKIWGNYGVNKLEAEEYLLKKQPNAYILRPPYLYGPMQNLYRELFLFDCAELGRRFYVPNEGNMKLQFFYIGDLCKIIEQVSIKQPEQHILNVGNRELVDINQFVTLCYKVVGKSEDIKHVSRIYNQRDYFCFHDYEYCLDVSKMEELLPLQKDFYGGLKESYEWYIKHRDDVSKKEYIKFIDQSCLKQCVLQSVSY